MSKISVSANVERAELRAVVTRADGTVEDLGVVATTDKPEQAPEQGHDDDCKNPE